MSSLTVEQAQALLQEHEVQQCMEGGLAEMREVREACLSAGIPAALDMEACEKPGCKPKAQLLVRVADMPQVAELLRQRWLKMVEELGVDPAHALPQHGEHPDGELPCPACGTAEPLVDGACSDCGLQLE